MGCHWCDVKESWPTQSALSLSETEIADLAKLSGCAISVITGGEPAMHPLAPITEALGAVGIPRHIETSGAYPLSGQWDWVTVSPKKFKPARPDVLTVADELKVVIYHSSDFKFAEQHAALVPPTCALVLQPEWSRAETAIPLIVDYVKNHPRWRVGLQTHKFLNVP